MFEQKWKSSLLLLLPWIFLGVFEKQKADKVTNEENIGFLSVTGNLSFHGHGALPYSAYVASHYQQRICRQHMADMRELNSTLKEVQNLQKNPLLYLAAPSDVKASYLAFFDASQGNYSYGKTGYIIWLLFQTESSLLYYVLDLALF